MPVAKSGQAIKKELLRIITVNIGSKTADMYCDFFDAHTSEVALNSAEELLVEFVGRQRAEEEIKPLRVRFSLIKTQV